MGRWERVAAGENHGPFGKKNFGLRCAGSAEQSEVQGQHVRAVQREALGGPDRQVVSGACRGLGGRK
jgi:hypothetical protein